MGYDTVLVTSVERDGTKRGPDIKLYEKLSGIARRSTSSPQGHKLA